MLPYNRGPRLSGGSPLSEEAEIALVLLVSEGKRKRGGFFSGGEQKIKFVSKFYYPFLLTPWKDRSLILNPVARGSLTLRHTKLPNMDSFISDLKRSSTARELYQVFLMDNLDTFRQGKQQKISLDRVISKEFGETLAKEARIAVNGPEQNGLVLEGQLDEGELQQEVEKFIGANDKIDDSVVAIDYALAQLQEGAAMHIKKIKEQIKETREKYEQEIIRVRPFVQKRIEIMRRDKDNEMRRLRKSSKEELTLALKEKAIQQRELMRLERLEAKCQREKKARKAVDKAAYNFWDNRLDKVKKEISNVRKAASKATLDGKVRIFAGTEPAKLFVSDDLGASWAEKPHFRDDVDTSEWTFPGEPHLAQIFPRTITGDFSRREVIMIIHNRQISRDLMKQSPCCRSVEQKILMKKARHLRSSFAVVVTVAFAPPCNRSKATLIAAWNSASGRSASGTKEGSDRTAATGSLQRAARRSSSCRGSGTGGRLPNPLIQAATAKAETDHSRLASRLIAIGANRRCGLFWLLSLAIWSSRCRSRVFSNRFNNSSA